MSCIVSLWYLCKLSLCLTETSITIRNFVFAADLFCFVMKDFLLSLSDTNQPNIVEALNFTTRYLDDLFNIDNPYFQQMLSQIKPTEPQLNKAYSSDTETCFLELGLSITNDIVSSKIYGKPDDFNLK